MSVAWGDGSGRPRRRPGRRKSTSSVTTIWPTGTRPTGKRPPRAKDPHSDVEKIGAAALAVAVAGALVLDNLHAIGAWLG